MLTVLIPAYQPDEKLTKLIKNCRGEGLESFVVVDDGSDRDSDQVFKELEELGCTVLRHEKNMGKGAALKTGFAFIAEKLADCRGVVTADADGQHLPEDIKKVADRVAPGKLILGARDFSGTSVPLRSRFGNSFSSAFFRLLTGVSCPDTQTGLRGFPVDLLPEALETEGDRYEYEMELLTRLADRKIPFEYVKIGTVYEKGNTTSHFRPVRDSLRIYRKPLRYASSSLICSGVDLGLFTVMNSFLFAATENRILFSTVLARLISGLVNFIINKKWSFQKKGNTGRQLTRYALLFFAQMFTSSALVQLISFLPIHDTLCKAVVDVALFFVSFAIQRRWVYREDR